MSNTPTYRSCSTRPAKAGIGTLRQCSISGVVKRGLLTLILGVPVECGIIQRDQRVVIDSSTLLDQPTNAHEFGSESGSTIEISVVSRRRRAIFLAITRRSNGIFSKSAFPRTFTARAFSISDAPRDSFPFK